MQTNAMFNRDRLHHMTCITSNNFKILQMLGYFSIFGFLAFFNFQDYQTMKKKNTDINGALLWKQLVFFSYF